jgi:hypothetical protein
VNAGNAIALAAFSCLFYQAGQTQESQQEWFYVTQGVTAAILFVYAARKAKPGIAVAALWWGAFEEAQVAACGIGGYGIPVPVGSGLCVERFGMTPYYVGFVLSVIYLWTCYANQNRCARR